MKHKTVRRSNILGKAVLVLATLVIWTSYASLRTKLDAVRADYEAVYAEYADLQQSTAEMSDVVTEGVTDRYVIKMARQKGYVLPGEKILIDIYSRN